MKTFTAVASSGSDLKVVVDFIIHVSAPNFVIFPVLDVAAAARKRSGGVNEALHGAAAIALRSKLKVKIMTENESSMGTKCRKDLHFTNQAFPESAAL